MFRLLCCFLLGISTMLIAQTQPQTRVENFSEVMHGQTLTDPYHWLEDGQSAETRSWITVENHYAQTLLDAQPMRKQIVASLTAMAHHEYVGVPVLRNGSYYFTKRQPDEERASFYRRKGVSDPDELLIDAKHGGPDADTSVSGFDVDPSGQTIAYNVRQGGRDEMSIHFFRMATHSDLADQLPNALYLGTAFTKDGAGFYYVLRSRIAPPLLKLHHLGTTVEHDTVIPLAGSGKNDWISPTISENGKYLLVGVQKGWVQSDLYIQDLTTHEALHPLIQDLPGKFDGAFDGDLLFVRTDWLAPRRRILRIDLHHPEQRNWQTVVPEGPDTLEDSGTVGGKLFAIYNHDVTSRVVILTLEGTPAGEVALPGIGSALLYGRSDQSEARLFFTSFTTPYSLYRYDVTTGSSALWYRDAVPFHSEDYVTEQVFYPSKDGTSIPMFLVHRKGLVVDSKTPTLLYGYGGFDVSLTPGFSSRFAWWMEQGGVFAVANIRGGGEYGEAWHQAGMLSNKQNVFDDFIAAAQYLIQQKHTSAGHLAIWGGSNGGLLVGAALTQRPDLYRAVVCWHPDLDMVRYYRYTKDNNPPALLEYGNAADPEQFKYVRAYSPYENVHASTKYPAVLFESGDADTRVPPEQARKMTARLQSASSSGHPVLLRYDTAAGHSAGLTNSQAIQEQADELTFVVWQLGIESH